MKTILLWDPRFPDRQPTRLTLHDQLASAIVRAGIAAAANPADAGALGVGGPLNPDGLTPVVMQHGINGDQLARALLPLSVVMVGAGLGLLASIGSPVSSGATPSPSPSPTPTPPPAALALTGALSYATTATAGTIVGLIGNVPLGAAPSVTPNDGRMVIAGDSTAGWKLVVGMSASTAGTVDVTIAAAGATSVTKTITIYVAASTATAFEPGYGMPSGNYFVPWMPLNNWGKFVSIGSNGNVTFPYAGIIGLANIKTNTGVTLLNSGHSSYNIISSDPATGQHRINVISDATDTDGRFIRWSGTQPTYFTVTRDGRTDKISAEWVAAVEGRWFRNLDMDNQNGLPFTGQLPVNSVNDAIYTVGGSFGFWLPIEDQVDGLAAKMAADPDFLGMWDVIPDNLTDAQITARATAQRDRAPSRAKFNIEFGNEQPWNGSFDGIRRLMADALRGGWYGAATYTSPQPSIDVTVYAGSTDNGNNNLSPVTAVGGRILFDRSGLGLTIWKAKQAVPAGAEIGENAYWTAEFSESDLRLAASRWRSVRHDQIIEIYRSVFGATRFAAQIQPVVMGQQAQGELIASLATERTFVPGYWDKVTHIGFSGYVGESNYDLLVNPNGATQAKILASLRGVGFPAMKDAIYKMVIDCATLGKKPAVYECGPHTGGAYGPSAVYRNTYNASLDGDDGYALYGDMAEFFKNYVPGPVMQYNMAGDKIGDVPSTASTAFSLRKNFADTTNKRYLGWRAGLARPVPAPATSGYRFIRFTPLGGSRQGQDASNSFYRVGWSGIGLAGGSGAIAPTTKWMIGSPSTYGGNAPRLLLDGEASTGFLTEQGSYVKTGTVTLDVGVGESVAPTVVTIAEGGAGREGFNPVGMKVEGSLDGTTWMQLASVPTMTFTSGVATLPLGNGAPPVGARYWRFTPVADATGGNSASSAGVYIGALEIDWLNDSTIIDKSTFTATQTGETYGGASYAQALDNNNDTNLFSKGTGVVVGTIDAQSPIAPTRIRFSAIGGQYENASFGRVIIQSSQDGTTWTTRFDNTTGPVLTYSPDFHTKGAFAFANLTP